MLITPPMRSRISPGCYPARMSNDPKPEQPRCRAVLLLPNLDGKLTGLR